MQHMQPLQWQPVGRMLLPHADRIHASCRNHAPTALTATNCSWSKHLRGKGLGKAEELGSIVFELCLHRGRCLGGVG